LLTAHWVCHKVPAEPSNAFVATPLSHNVFSLSTYNNRQFVWESPSPVPPSTVITRVAGVESEVPGIGDRECHGEDPGLPNRISRDPPPSSPDPEPARNSIGIQRKVAVRVRPVPEKVTDSLRLIVMFWIGASITHPAPGCPARHPQDVQFRHEVHGFPFTSDSARSRRTGHSSR